MNTLTAFLPPFAPHVSCNSRAVHGGHCQQGCDARDGRSPQHGGLPPRAAGRLHQRSGRVVDGLPRQVDRAAGTNTDRRRLGRGQARDGVHGGCAAQPDLCALGRQFSHPIRSRTAEQASDPAPRSEEASTDCTAAASQRLGRTEPIRVAAARVGPARCLAGRTDALVPPSRRTSGTAAATTGPAATAAAAATSAVASTTTDVCTARINCSGLRPCFRPGFRPGFRPEVRPEVRPTEADRGGTGRCGA